MDGWLPHIGTVFTFDLETQTRGRSLRSGDPSNRNFLSVSVNSQVLYLLLGSDDRD
jgi:hypothetical protein